MSLLRKRALMDIQFKMSVLIMIMANTLDGFMQLI